MRRSELMFRARVARQLTTQHLPKEVAVMKVRKNALIAVSVGLLMITFSPFAAGGFYPIVMSIGIATAIFGTWRLMRRPREH